MLPSFMQMSTIAEEIIPILLFPFKECGRILRNFNFFCSNNHRVECSHTSMAQFFRDGKVIFAVLENYCETRNQKKRQSKVKRKTKSGFYLINRYLHNETVI